jgi:tetratricopeptide (TPR) repeat protein
MAVNLAAQIHAVDANYRDVSAILASASNELRYRRSATSVDLQLKEFFDQADTAAASGRLLEAASILQQVLRTSPNEPQARARLDDVNRRLAEQENQRKRHTRLERLYTLAQSKVRSGDWRWATNILEEISAVQPDYQDVPQLLAQARTELGAAEAEIQPGTDVASLRDQAEAAMANGRWAEAVRLWEDVMRLEPGLAGIDERLETARYQARLAALNAEAAQLAAAGRWQEAIQKVEEIKTLGGTASL